MIRECFTYLTTPCPPLYRRMGYLKECVGIESRYRRNRLSWAKHLEASRGLILQAAEDCAERDSVLVFGAGLLHDIPLDALLGRFERVILADLVFMAPVRRRARHEPRLELASLDVTASLATLAEGGDTLSRPKAYLEDPRISLVVSANILSQLSIVPNAFREKRFRKSEAEADDLGRRLVEAHLAYLRTFSCPVVLITDEERIVKDKSGAEMGRLSALHDVTLPTGGKSWIWEVCPLGELDRSYAVAHKVRGCLISAPG